MHKHLKGSDGLYHIKGKSYSVLVGSRAQVWHGSAYHTSGGLKKDDLMQNSAGRIVSKSKHFSAKREKRLLKYGYGTRKGHFGAVKLSGVSKKKRGSKRRGSKKKARRGTKKRK